VRRWLLVWLPFHLPRWLWVRLPLWFVLQWCDHSLRYYFRGSK
jgi:hypothetical protein